MHHQVKRMVRKKNHTLYMAMYADTDTSDMSADNEDMPHSLQMNSLQKEILENFSQ